MMKRFGTFALLTGALLLPSGLHAQDDWEDRWERIAEQIERALERAAEQTERALERMEARLERSNAWDGDMEGAWDFDFDFDFDWDSDDWEGWGGWDRDEGPRVDGEDFEWRGRVAQGDVLEIKGVSGTVRAVRGSGSEVEVVAMRSARRSDPDEVSIEVLEHRGGVTLCALYPTPSRARRDNECGIGDEGRMQVQRNDTQVDWEIRVPAGVDFHVRNVNGDVEAMDLESDVQVETVNGDLNVSTSGTLEGTTVNGSIEAAFDRLTQDASFETVNGTIELDLDDDVDARVDASWVNGSFESDLPMRIQGRIGRRSAQGTLGNGGPELRLRTVNGSIQIR